MRTSLCRYVRYFVLFVAPLPQKCHGARSFLGHRNSEASPLPLLAADGSGGSRQLLDVSEDLKVSGPRIPGALSNASDEASEPVAAAADVVGANAVILPEDGSGESGSPGADYSALDDEYARWYRRRERSLRIVNCLRFAIVGCTALGPSVLLLQNMIFPPGREAALADASGSFLTMPNASGSESGICATLSTAELLYTDREMSRSLLTSDRLSFAEHRTEALREDGTLPARAGDRMMGMAFRKIAPDQGCIFEKKDVLADCVSVAGRADCASVAWDIVRLKQEDETLTIDPHLFFLYNQNTQRCVVARQCERRDVPDFRVLRRVLPVIRGARGGAVSEVYELLSEDDHTAELDEDRHRPLLKF